MYIYVLFVASCIIEMFHVPARQSSIHSGPCILVVYRSLFASRRSLGLSMAMDVPSHIRRLADASGMLDKDDLRAIDQCAEIGKEVMRASIEQVVKASLGSPILSSKSADGTPITVMKRVCGSLPSGQKIKRSGRECHEFLVSNQIVRCRLPDGSTMSRCMLADPMPLSYGKSAPAIFEACSKYWTTMRQLGHAGCSIEHYVFDRFGIISHERLWRQWHSMVSDDVVNALESDLPHNVLKLTEFVLVTACALHDAHNAFRWALFWRFRDTDLIRDCYVGIEALRRSMGLISSHVAEWVVLHLRFDPPCSQQRCDERKALWDALDVDLETSDLLAHTLQLFYRDGCLHVSAECQFMPGLVDLVTNCLLSCWRFVRWSESRFLTVGSASRTIVAAFLTGISGLVGFIKKDPEASMFYLNGFFRFKEEQTTFMVQCAIISRVADSVMQDLMEDSRVAKRYDQLWELLAEEMYWVVSLSDAVWRDIAEACHSEPSKLKADCIAGAHVSFHFFWRRVLELASKRPWSLARGDLKGNLDELKEETEPPGDPFSCQMWHLLRRGFSFQQLVNTLLLMQDVPWTSMLVEQQHASLACLMRFHPEYGANTLVGRALVLQLRRLLPSESAEEKLLRSYTHQLMKLSAKNPEKASGRHAMISELFAMVRKRVQMGLPKHQEADRDIFRCHVAWWNRCSAAQRRDFELRASLTAAQKRRENAAESAHLRAAREALQERLEEDRHTVKPLLMSQCAWGQEHFDHFAVLAETPAFQSEAVAKRRSAIQASPPPSAAKQEQMSRQEVWADGNLRMPEWACDVANRRDFFVDTAFVVSVDDGAEPQYWKFLYAVQSPTYYVALCPLKQKETHLPEPTRPTIVLSTRRERVRFCFHCNFACMASAADVDVPLEKVKVLRALKHTGGTEVVSCERPELLQDYFHRIPERVRNAAGGSGGGTGRRSDSLVELYPWLREHQDKTHGFTDQSTGGDRASGSAPGSKEETAHLDDEDIQQMLEDLDKARAALSADPEPSTDDFKVSVLGGHWTMEHHGVGADAVMGSARGNAAKAFCTRRGVQQGIRFNYSVYGAEACGILARGWCHKMQHFYNLELSRPNGRELVFGAERVETYREPTEFARLSEGAAGAVTNRIRQIRDLLTVQ